MFSKRSSDILNNNPNSMNKIGKKLSNSAIKNISLNNPAENADMQLPLSQLNALPLNAPTTLNKFPISKNNNIQKNVDMDEFLLSINECDKTLQTISIIVSTVLTGGAENEEDLDNKLGAYETKEVDDYDYDYDEYLDSFTGEDDNNDRNFHNLDETQLKEAREEFERQNSIRQKEDELESIDNEINAINKYISTIEQFNFIYAYNDPLKIIRNLYTLYGSNNEESKQYALRYLNNEIPIFNHVNNFTPDAIEIYIKRRSLPFTEQEYNEEIERMKQAQKELNQSKLQVQFEINSLKKTNKKEISQSSKTNSKNEYIVENVGVPQGSKYIAVPSKNNPQPEVLKKEYVVENVGIPRGPKYITVSPNTKSSNAVDDKDIPIDIIDNENEINMNEEDINKKIKELQKVLTIENNPKRQEIYSLPNADKIILDMKRYKNPKNPKEQGQALGRLKRYLSMEEQEVINYIPKHIEDYETLTKHNSIIDETNSRLKELKLSKENKKLSKESESLKGTVNISDYIKSKEPIITAMSKFNSQMNRLYIFFKGKIKPNLKIISKSEILEGINDMNVLQSNFKDVYLEVQNKFHNVFGVEKLKHTKADQFVETWVSNFNKISSDIIANLKAYSNISTYTTQGGILMLNSIRHNMYKGNKYLL